MSTVFKNRSHAGMLLAEELRIYKENAVCIGLIRGGVIVAKSISDELAIPLYGFVVQKIGAPLNPELAIGAVTSEDSVFLNKEIISTLFINDADISASIKRAKREYIEKEKYFKSKVFENEIKGKTVILCDDGIATGSSIISACKTIRKYTPEKIIAACPVCSPDAAHELKKHADTVVCLKIPDDFICVSKWYEYFRQVPGGLVRNIINQEDLQTAKK